MKEFYDSLYREILIAKQFEAIKAARKGKRKEVVDLADDLIGVIVKVGDGS